MIFPPAVSGAAVAYEIEKSLRFRASASAQLSRTQATPTDNRKWTWSGWCKITPGVSNTMFSATTVAASPNGRISYIVFDSTGFIEFFESDQPTASSFQKRTSALYRDPSAHYHIVASLDSTDAVASERAKLYVNGVRVTSFAISSDPPLNHAGAINKSGVIARHGTIQNNIGGGFIGYLDGYLSEINFIDGQALTPSSFGLTDANGVWQPKKYTGTYGTNGFYLPFNDGTNLTNLCLDRSGNGNNWTANNISLTAGVSYDWMDDTPTNNHCTLNNLVAGAANITKANLASGTTAVRATFNALAINSYWEVTAGGSNVTAGVINDAGTTNTVTVTANKVFAFRLSTAGALDYRNVTDAGGWTSITTGLTGNQFPYGATAAADWNFGQRPFSGAVPGGYAKLCAANIAAGSITTSGSFTGNASADGPFVWLNGVPTAMTINGNAVTFGTHADKTAGGFKVRSSSASYNAAGSNTYSITTTGAAFKNARAQVNP